MKKKRVSKKKGFSLVELIIVIAIMVSLVALIAPTYVKYANQARDMTILHAAEEVLTFTKTEFGDGSMTGNGKIHISSYENDGKLIGIRFVSGNTFTYTVDGVDYTGLQAQEKFSKACNLKTNRSKSTLIYEISITGTKYTSYQITLEEFNNTDG